MNKTVLIKCIRKDGKGDFCVISKIALTNWVISDPCRSIIMCFEIDTKQFLSIKNIYNS